MTLAGTLLLPLISELQYVPGVVLVAGSGPTDRDGNNALVLERIDLLKEIAELLARHGIASLRYDKRGIGQSTLRPRDSLAAEEAFFAWDNFVADVEAAHTELLRHNEIKPYATALLGHSEGGLLSLAAGKALGKKVHALVLAATPGRKLDEIVRAQVERNAPTLRSPVDHTIATILANGRVPAGLPRELDLLFPPYAGPFLQKLLSFDPAAVLAEIPTACLVLQGQRRPAGRADGRCAAADRCTAHARCAGRGHRLPAGQPQSQACRGAQRSRSCGPAGAHGRRSAREVAGAGAGCLIARSGRPIIGVKTEEEI